MTGFRRRTQFLMPTVLVKCGDFDPIPLCSTGAWMNRCGAEPLHLILLLLYTLIRRNATSISEKEDGLAAVLGFREICGQSTSARYRKVTMWARLQAMSMPKRLSLMPLVTPFSTAQLMGASYHMPDTTSLKLLAVAEMG